MKLLRSGVILLLLLSFISSSCVQKHGEEDDAGDSAIAPLVAVKISRLRTGNMEAVVTATGKTEAVHREKVLSPVSGTLLSLKVLEGSPVKKGMVLAIIRPRETQAAIAGAEALLRSAQTPAERLDAQAALDLARKTQNVLNVRAGFDGVVATRIVSEGELVSEAAELMTLIDLASVMFVADVPLQDVPRVHPGQHASVQFHSSPGKRFPAVVDGVNPQSDLQSQTVRVRLRFGPSDTETRRQLKTEMMGVGSIVTGIRHNVFIIPKAAILRDDEKGRSSVVIVNPDSTAHILPVAVGGSTDSTVEIFGSGLASGMPVVVEGNYALADSTKVTW
jgi:multidrug efflux pump subunit AcrA (membrane-fusion protein)